MSFERFEADDMDRPSSVPLSEYDRKSVVWTMDLVDRHLAKLLDETGWHDRITQVDGGILTWRQVLGQDRQDEDDEAMKAKAKLNVRVDSIEAFFKDVLDLSFFVDVVKCHYEPGESKLVLVTGENATGKSFVRRVIGAALSEHSIESIALSMQKRAGGIDRMMNAFIWGDESTHATSSLSSNAIIGAIRTSRGREQRHAIVWDEPDVGLSDNYAAGAADEIVEFVNDPPERLFFAVVTTHRLPMLKRLARCKPHHLRLGDDKTLAQVLAAKVTPKRLSELKERDHKMFLAIHREFGL